MSDTNQRMKILTGYSGQPEVRFEAPFQHGKGTRWVGIIVHRDMVVRLARAFEFNPNSGGHASWHANNPQSVMPCSSCELSEAARAALAKVTP